MHEPSRGERLASLVNYVREEYCLDVMLVFDAVMRTVLLESELISAGHSSNLQSFSGTLDVNAGSNTERGLLTESRADRGQTFWAQKKLLNRLVLIHEKNDKKKIRAGRMILLSPCEINGKVKSQKLRVWPYVECMPSFVKVNEALESVHL